MNYTEQLESDLKRIISVEFSSERDKKRLTDHEKNLELVSLLGNALTTIEMGVKDKVKRYLKGEGISSIIPEITE